MLVLNISLLLLLHYNHNASPPLIEDKALETALTPIPVKLTPAAFGTSYTSNAGDGLEITHTGPGQGAVSVDYFEPQRNHR